MQVVKPNSEESSNDDSDEPEASFSPSPGKGSGDEAAKIQSRVCEVHMPQLQRSATLLRVDLADRMSSLLSRVLLPQIAALRTEMMNAVKDDDMDAVGSCVAS